MRIVIILVLMISVIPTCLSQTGSIVPHAQGDTWYEVEYSFGRDPDTVSRTIEYVSVVGEGRYRFRYNSSVIQYEYDTTGRLYTVGADDSLYLWLDFTAAPGDRWGNMGLDTILSSTVFGVKTKVFVFTTWSGAAGSSSQINRIHYAAGIGRILLDLLGPANEKIVLVGAVLNGVQYGQVLSVGAPDMVAYIGSLKLECYPNPARQWLHMNIDGMGANGIIAVVDRSGRTVYQEYIAASENIITHTWDCTDLLGNKLPRGVYIVFVSNNAGVCVRKINLQ